MPAYKPVPDEHLNYGFLPPSCRMAPVRLRRCAPPLRVNEVPGADLLLRPARLEPGAPVLRPAGLVVLLAHRLLFTIPDGVELLARGTEVLEVLRHRGGAALAELQVVLLG